MENIESTLDDREAAYGSFLDNSIVTQKLKNVVRDFGRTYHDMSPDKAEAIDMIFHKISRIVNGDSGYRDSWHDIIGYAKLVEDTLDDY
jgi:hypothetical protein